MKTILVGHDDLLRGFEACCPQIVHSIDDDDDNDDDGAEVTGMRTVEERNAAGFANAIELSDDDESHGHEDVQAAVEPRRSKRKRGGR